MSTLSRVAYAWGVRCFGIEQMTNRWTRSLRIGEEALELCQASGVDRETAHKLVDQVYDRPVGYPYQELGGIAMTHVIFCEMMGVDFDRVLEDEIQRVLSKPVEHFAARNGEKMNAVGRHRPEPGP